MCSATMRAMVSLLPPAENGTIIVMARSGNASVGPDSHAARSVVRRLVEREGEGDAGTVAGHAVLVAPSTACRDRDETGHGVAEAASQHFVVGAVDGHAARGWGKDRRSANLTEDESLARSFRLNQERAAQQANGDVASDAL